MVGVRVARVGGSERVGLPTGTGPSSRRVTPGRLSWRTGDGCLLLIVASGSAARLRAGLPGGVTNCSSSSSCTRDEGKVLRVPRWSSWTIVIEGVSASRSTLEALDSDVDVDWDVGVVAERVGDGPGLLGVQIIEEVARRARPRVLVSTTMGVFKSACMGCIVSFSGDEGWIGAAGVLKDVAETAETIGCC